MNKFHELRRKYIIETCRDLSFPDFIKEKSLDILNEIEKKLDFSGIPPRIISLTIIFIAHKENISGISDYSLCKKLGTTYFTIEKHMNKIKQNLKEDKNGR